MKRIICISLSAIVGTAVSAQPPIHQPQNPATETRHLQQSEDVAFSLQDALTRTMHEHPSLLMQLAKIKSKDGDQLLASAHPDAVIEAEVENFIGTGVFSGVDAAEASLGMSYTLERGNKRENRMNVVEAERAILKQQVQQVTRQLLYRTRSDYAKTVIASERLRLRGEELQLAKQTHQAVSQLVEAALSPELDRIRENLSVKQQEHALMLAKLELDAAWAQLATNWGAFDGDIELPYSFQNSMQTEEPPELDQLLKLVDQHPEIQQFENLRNQNTAELELVQSEAIADLDLFAGARYFNEEGGDAALVLGASMPFINKDKIEGGKMIARSKSKLLQAERNEMLRQLKTRIVSSLHHMKIAHAESSNIQSDLLPRAVATMEEVRKGYEQGLYTQLQLLEARKVLFELKENYLDALERYQEAQNEMWELTSFEN